MSLKGKVAIVTGASGNGMGRSIALTLARQGACTVINYLKNEKAAEEIVGYIRENGGNAIAVQGDLFDQKDCQKLVNAAITAYGKVDICIIGPGAGWNPEGLLDLDAQKSLEDVIKEVSGVYHLLPLVLNDMQKRHWGRVIGIASNMTIPSPAYSYNVAKASRTEALLSSVKKAWELGVTVNVIAPGPVDAFSSFQEACACSCEEEAWVGRKKVTPQDIAEGVAFICSDCADYISGCILPYLF